MTASFLTPSFYYIRCLDDNDDFIEAIPREIRVQ